ncbi:threonine/serine exporter family protein [Clostridium sp. JN-9]|uniref:threonine/serine exporter family protein n=1 Tax=Clostridium sp. JN-9 TaxID=2507159 RepID=UPI000FFE2B2D|nr:threonine/serine exporter family protein [Clostridium sp. JN-9]QAT40264.1 threonine/serine exporter [Clostridium sp. JN-9]
MVLNFIYASIATLAFGIIFNIRGKNLVFASLGGGISWAVYLLSLKFFSSMIFAYFLAAAIVTLYSEIMARVLKTPVTTFVICAIIPVVPGGGMYNTMMESVKGNVQTALSMGVQTITIAGAIAVGILFISTIVKIVIINRNKK